MTRTASDRSPDSEASTTVIATGQVEVQLASTPKASTPTGSASKGSVVAELRKARLAIAHRGNRSTSRPKQVEQKDG